MEFTLISQSGEQEKSLTVNRLIIAGWTGRDKVAMEKHIVELESLGIARPASTPIFYRVANSRLTANTSIEASGERSSGEVEPVYVNSDGEYWVGVGSDHTDREVEAFGVTVSKQMCDKPVSSQLWPMSEITDHWDSIIVRSHIIDGSNEELYQEGTLAAMLPPDELFKRFKEDTNTDLAAGDVMFGGTLAAIGGIRPSKKLKIEMEDPVIERKLSHTYSITELPILG